MKNYSELWHCLTLQISCQSPFFFFPSGWYCLSITESHLHQEIFCKPVGCHLSHKFLLRFNPVCSLSPSRKRLYLPETCPAFVIVLAGLMTLVVQINVFFCMGLWSIILINLWIIKMSYKTYHKDTTPPHHDCQLLSLCLIWECDARGWVHGNYWHIWKSQWQHEKLPENSVGLWGPVPTHR